MPQSLIWGINSSCCCKCFDDNCYSLCHVSFVLALDSVHSWVQCACMCVCSPQLMWRDMQYIVVMTARQVNLKADDWVVNGIGRKGDRFTHTHTHTRLTTLCPGLPGWSGTRKEKSFWIFQKQETMSGSGISWAICKSAPRSRQITMPANHHSVFLQAGCSSCRPTNSIKALKVLGDRFTWVDNTPQIYASTSREELSFVYSLLWPYWCGMPNTALVVTAEIFKISKTENAFVTDTLRCR